MNRDWDDHLALWVLDHAQALMSGPAHGTVKLLLHTSHETFDV